MNIKEINLNNLKLKTFTEQDALDYCQINNINPDNITVLKLYNNKLTDISGIKIFKNLKELNLRENELTDISVLKDLNKLEILYLSFNSVTDISVIQYLNNLKHLTVGYLRLESDQIQYIKSLKKLESLNTVKGFKDMSVLNQLNKDIIIYE